MKIITRAAIIFNNVFIYMSLKLSAKLNKDLLWNLADSKIARDSHWFKFVT